MQFIDRVKIKVKAGDGGKGMSSFRREKYVPFGGPSGGDGGKGGDIVFMVDEGKSTLLDLRYNRKVVAPNGVNGKTKKMHGAVGEDAVIKVPLGTIVKDAETGRILADLTRKNQRAIICKGGKGGRGNFRFKTSKNTAPTYAEKGGLGEVKDVEVELKVLADVGLVGYPSVGKSTLLSVVSAAKPEIADYHFTTIQPNLGMVQVPDGRSFVMADLPGLIDGAAQGKGLGHQFLRHIERCRVIIHVVDMGAQDGRDPVQDYANINKELEEYQYRLLERPQVVVANKMDLDDAEANLARFKEAYPDVEIYPTMTALDEGLEPIIYKAADLLEVTPVFPLYDEEEKSEGVLYKYEGDKPPFKVHNLGNGRWKLTGEEIETAFAMATLDTDEGQQRFARKMRVLGVDSALREAGAADGDTIELAEFEFEFVE
ncbi:GTP-binding protein [Breznakia blatticola]|uniref:GTPase Obg n=1 Tax=Breznakia blatticola TaxID=1754012 RepID=A0A4R7ZCT3_9FIRM|nr:GTPase ObgE [Breznakia blatticola]TDW14676.1 GTP-binding protein [Breznakia blatticola]